MPVIRAKHQGRSCPTRERGREFHYTEQTRQSLLEGVEKLAKAVRETLDKVRKEAVRKSLNEIPVEALRETLRDIVQEIPIEAPKRVEVEISLEERPEKKFKPRTARRSKSVPARKRRFYALLNKAVPLPFIHWTGGKRKILMSYCFKTQRDISKERMLLISSFNGDPRKVLEKIKVCMRQARRALSKQLIYEHKQRYQPAIA